MTRSLGVAARMNGTHVTAGTDGPRATAQPRRRTASVRARAFTQPSRLAAAQRRQAAQRQQNE